MTTGTLGATAILLLLAYAAARLTRRHVPELVGYLVVGALLGPTGLGLLARAPLHQLAPVSVIPVAVLMFSIGERISLRSFRTERWLAVVAPMSFVLTALAVVFAAHAAGAPLGVAGLLAVMGGGGAPMTVAAVVGGEPGETRYGRALIGLHASCDALAALAFSIVFPLVYLYDGAGGARSGLLHEVFQLGAGGALLGVALGLTLAQACARLSDPRRVAAATGAHVVAAGAISAALGLSVPLAALVMGAIAASRAGHERSQHLFAPIRRTEPALYLVFFTLAGAAIRLNALPAMGVIGAGYVAARVCAKLASALIAAVPTGLTRTEALRIGSGSIPHAGVSVGLVAVASAALPGRGIATVTLSAIVIFELAGALIVRRQLRRARPGPREHAPQSLAGYPC